MTFLLFAVSESNYHPRDEPNHLTPATCLRRSRAPDGKWRRIETPSSKWKIPDCVSEEACRGLWRVQLSEVAVGDCGRRVGLRRQINSILTKPIEGQKTGTSGLRKKIIIKIAAGNGVEKIRLKSDWIQIIIKIAAGNGVGKILVGKLTLKSVNRYLTNLLRNLECAI